MATGELPAASAPELLKRARGRCATNRKIALGVRMNRANALAEAIRDAHPDDARQLLTAALFDLMAGVPPHTAFGDIREDARWWAATATPVELLEYLGAALRALGGNALCLQQRKDLFKVLWSSFSDGDRHAFIRHVRPGKDHRDGA